MSQVLGHGLSEHAALLRYTPSVCEALLPLITMFNIVNGQSFFPPGIFEPVTFIQFAVQFLV